MSVEACAQRHHCRLRSWPECHLQVQFNQAAGLPQCSSDKVPRTGQVIHLLFQSDLAAQSRVAGKSVALSCRSDDGPCILYRCRPEPGLSTPKAHTLQHASYWGSQAQALLPHHLKEDTDLPQRVQQASLARQMLTQTGCSPQPVLKMWHLNALSRLWLLGALLLRMQSAMLSAQCPSQTASGGLAASQRCLRTRTEP